MAQSRRSLTMVASLLLVTSALAGPVAAQSTVTGTDKATLVVDLSADGSATVTLVRGFDLTTNAERTTFERLRENESAQAQIQTQYTDRMDAVADTLAAETGRETTVSAAGTTVSVEGDTGMVALSVDLDRLAAVEGDRVVLAEPFAGDFKFDGTVDVRAPDGYRLVEAAVAPESDGEGVATWTADDGLDGYRAVFAPGDGTAVGVTTSTSAPGFGLLAGLTALVGLVALASARRRR